MPRSAVHGDVPQQRRFQREDDLRSPARGGGGQSGGYLVVLDDGAQVDGLSAAPDRRVGRDVAAVVFTVRRSNPRCRREARRGGLPAEALQPQFRRVLDRVMRKKSLLRNHLRACIELSARRFAASARAEPHAQANQPAERASRCPTGPDRARGIERVSSLYKIALRSTSACKTSSGTSDARGCPSYRRDRPPRRVLRLQCDRTTRAMTRQVADVRSAGERAGIAGRVGSVVGIPVA